MGTSAPSYMNSTSFFKTFKSQFRPIEIKGEKVDGQVYVCDANQEMIIEYPNRILDQESDELWHQTQSMIQQIQAPYIINYYGSAERQSQQMCSSYSTIFSYYEFVPHTLEKEINERKDNREQFSEKEIWYLLWCLAQALYELKQKGYNHKDLRPQTIALKRYGTIKLSPIGVLQNQKNSVARFVVENQQTYLPPTLKISLINKSQPQINWNKIDSFALGHIILDLMILDIPVLIDNQQIAQYQMLCYNRFSQHLIRIMEHLMLETDNQLLIEDVYFLLKPYSEKINKLQDFQFNFEDVKQLAIPLNNVSKLKLKQIIEHSYKHSEILYESQQVDNINYQQQIKVNLQQPQQQQQQQIQHQIIEQQKQQLIPQQPKQQQIQQDQLQYQQNFIQQQIQNQPQQNQQIIQQQIQQQYQQSNTLQYATTQNQQPAIHQQIIQQPLQQQQQIIPLQQQQNILQQQQIAPQQHVIIQMPSQQQQPMIQNPDLKNSVSLQSQQFANQQPQLLQRLLMQSQQIPQQPQIPPQQLQSQPVSTPISPINPIKITQQYYQPQIAPPPPPPTQQNIYAAPLPLQQAPNLQQAPPPLQQVPPPFQQAPPPLFQQGLPPPFQQSPPPSLQQAPPPFQQAPPPPLQQIPIQQPVIQQTAPVQMPIIYLNRPPSANNYNQSPPGQKIPVQLAQTVHPMNGQYDREITVLEYKPQGNQPLKASNQVLKPQQQYSSPQTRQSNNFDRIRNVIQDSDELLQQQHK